MTSSSSVLQSLFSCFSSSPRLVSPLWVFSLTLVQYACLSLSVVDREESRCEMPALAW